MPTPDPATLAAGTAIGGNAATPLIAYTRRKDLLAADWLSAAEVTPVGVIVTAGKAKTVSVIAGAATSADPATNISLKLYRGGSSVATLWSGTLGSWAALTAVSLASPGTVTQINDVIVLSFTKGTSGVLPALTFVVEQNIGL